MAKINLTYDGPEGAKLKRALEAFALQQAATVEAVLLPTLRAIAQQVGLDANDDEADQEAALAKAERKGNKAKADREARQKAAETAAAAAAPKIEPPTTTTN